MRFALAAFAAAALATLAGCSNPIPVSPRGAFYLQTSQPPGCSIFGNHVGVGDLSTTTVKERLLDGTNCKNGVCASVDCTVAGTKTFSVDGFIADPAISGAYFEVHIPAITSDATEDSPAKGTGKFSAEWTAYSSFQGECDFFLTGEEAVATGKAWMSFTCDSLAYSDGHSSCPVTVGYAVFENCLTD